MLCNDSKKLFIDIILVKLNKCDYKFLNKDDYYYYIKNKKMIIIIISYCI